MKTNFFVQPNGQSRTYSSYAVARKSALKRNFLFRWFIGITLLSCLMGQGVYAYSGEDSRNGESVSAHGAIRVSVVFAEVTGDPNYNNDTWPWMAGQMPPNADQIFDPQLWIANTGLIGGNGQSDMPHIIGGGVIGGGVIGGGPSAPTKKFTQFFYDASFGDLVVKGDYYPTLVKIPYNEITSQRIAVQKILDVLASESNPKSKTGLSIPSDFDAWTPSYYQEKSNKADGHIDNLIIIWRINSRLSMLNGSGQAIGGCSSSDGKIRSNNTQTIYDYDFLSNVTIAHEFSHELLGSNDYHNGGAGAGLHRFMTNVGGYGILESYNHNLRSCNAWDRYRLGWKKSAGYPDIYAHDLNGNVVNGDIPYRIPKPSDLNSSTVYSYVLRDFLTTGDAIRIRLPYLEQGGNVVEPQWIWIENHVSDTGRLYYSKGSTCPMGVRINLQIGGERFKNFNSRTNYYVPISRFGRWDFEVVPTLGKGDMGGSMVNVPFIPALDTFQTVYQTPNVLWSSAYTTSDRGNPFTGNSLLESQNYDLNGDRTLQNKENFTIKYVYKDGTPVGAAHPIFGNEYDVFHVGDVLSISTNPSTTPLITHNTKEFNDSVTGIAARDNRVIYLNGLKIHIKEKWADGSVVVEVTQGYYNVNQDQRWCGDIVLNEKISLGALKKIHLDLGRTPIVKTRPITIGNKRYFTEPTVLTCKANSILTLGNNSKIEIDSLCALVLEAGSLLEKRSESGTATIHVKSGGTLVVASGVAFNNGEKIILEVDSGGYACLAGTTASNFILDNKGTLNAVHPYLQQVKGLMCGNGKSAKSGNVTEEPNDTPEKSPNPVYQSFFEGNPVYYQMWDVYEYKWETGMTIKKHGLEGDTTVDGTSYHILSVVGASSEKENGHSVQFWVRENETHDKVWVRLPWDGEGREFLAVDMNLQPGDLFPVGTPSDTVYYEVDTVYYKEHVGGNLKHIRLKPTTDSSWTQALYEVGQIPWWHRECDWRSYHLEFIEGVGSNLGYVYYRLGLFDENEDALWKPLCHRDGYRNYYSHHHSLMPYDYIVCMERNGVAYYEHPNAECVSCTDKYVRLDEVIYDEGDPRDTNGRTPPANERIQSMSRHLSVSPNPAAETATLQWDASADSRVAMAACRITLYDLQGVRLRSYTTDRWPYTLSVADLTPGAYLLLVVPAGPPADGAWQATVRLMVR